jgi:hypothetical protein
MGRVLALPYRHIAAADAETGQVAFVRSVPSFCPRHSLAVERRFVVSAGVLFRRQFALAPQFREAGVDRRKIIGSTGSGHVSSDRFLPIVGRRDRLFERRRMLALTGPITQAEITCRARLPP